MKKRKRRTRTPLSGNAALSIKEFCDAHGISVTYYYKMRNQGTAPREMRVGRRWLISQEAAAAWRKWREEVASR